MKQIGRFEFVSQTTGTKNDLKHTSYNLRFPCMKLGDDPAHRWMGINKYLQLSLHVRSGYFREIQLRASLHNYFRVDKDWQYSAQHKPLYKESS